MTALICVILAISYLTTGIIMIAFIADATRRPEPDPLPNDCRRRCDGLKDLLDCYPDPSREGAYRAKFRCETCGETYLDDLDLQEVEQ